MFTIKQYFGNTNYHAYSAASYFVDREPNDTLEGSAPNPDLVTHDAKVPNQCDPNVVYPRITLDLACGGQRIVDVIGETYIENAAGKTIDVIRPYPRDHPRPRKG